jgi:crotonobetainyl-CoA:carnitine CoA-transferase CaiB-like acyl-CoA transferase
VSILDLSIWRPGPYATSLLCALGADVLKVEPPGGDPMRHYPELFAAVNAGKRSIVLDLKSPEGRSRALELAGAADVVVEGFRPGVMARLGLVEGAVRALNPGVVYCSISGYGQTDPRAELPGHDINYQAWAGALSPEGGRATDPPLPTADLASGLAAAFGVCAALLGRVAGASGSYLDVAMTDVMATWTGSATTATATATAAGAVATAGAVGTNSSSVPGYGLFDTADDQQVALGVLNEQHFWSALCGELGLMALSELDFEHRTRRSHECNGAVRDAIRRRHRDELVHALITAGVPVAPVLDRASMVAGAPFPPFPIRLGPATAAAPAAPPPTLDQHRGEGFLSRDPPNDPSTA